jgi:hypothetical protein
MTIRNNITEPVYTQEYAFPKNFPMLESRRKISVMKDEIPQVSMKISSIAT